MVKVALDDKFYVCKHGNSLHYRCLECDAQHNLMPREYIEELRLLRALASEVQELADIKIPLSKPVKDLLKVIRLYGGK